MKTGEQLKREGQDKMQRIASGWLGMALDKLKEYLTYRYSEGKIVMDFDSFRASLQCSEPPHPNAWGALPRAAARAGFINATNYTVKADRPAAHARRVRLWSICPEAL